MVDIATLDSLRQLSVEDRREVIEELWLSPADEPFVPELTDELKQELERRRDAVIAHPERSRTWSQVVCSFRAN
ncbi:MAG: addiction module protein [Planctomycetaceae bacterium]